MTRRDEVLELLGKAKEPMTGNEICAKLQIKGTIYNLLNDLERLKLISTGDKRECSVSGGQATCYTRTAKEAPAKAPRSERVTKGTKEKAPKKERAPRKAVVKKAAAPKRKAVKEAPPSKKPSIRVSRKSASVPAAAASMKKASGAKK